MNRAGNSRYAAAGVDIDAKMAALAAVKPLIKRTVTPGVASDIGLFGGLFVAPGNDSLLVASTDGVGTKLKVAVMAGRHDTVGQDIVNHCVNDILVQGARPLFFLDYLAMSKFQPDIFKQVIAGLCKACRENACALLGGETAEMPGLYPPGEYDLVGTIVGVVRKKEVITGEEVRPGDCVIGLASTGLHTNGYSLARQVLFAKLGLDVWDTFPGLGCSVAKVLLAVHKSYLRPVMRLMESVKVRGMAHITGGGFFDNIPRILPKGTMAVINTGSWRVPRLFEVLAEHGNVTREEMYRVFNMGIGYVVIVRPADLSQAMNILAASRSGAKVIGRIESGERCVKLEP
ncbi:MAG: phosphoribosylformylglycinamidine cyclo-ligase [Kiritimatiellae bacterium]|nr:phosphoribosylformylglycinamidine cyclo-ligase [Kiritimatiellia bacterium]